MASTALLPRWDSKQLRKRSRASEITLELISEITRKKAAETYQLDSEHQLMARFGVSRITIRLVLSELEHAGLIFRQHGRGTFVRGWATQVRRPLAVLLNLRGAHAVRNVMDFTEGVTTAQTLEGASVFISSSPPATWGEAIIGVLAGVLIVGDALADGDLVSLKSHRVTYLHVGRDRLDRRGNCFDFGRDLGAAFYSYAQTGTALPSDYLVVGEDKEESETAASEPEELEHAVSPSRIPVLRKSKASIRRG